jgi:hypothetical protein
VETSVRDLNWTGLERIHWLRRAGFGTGVSEHRVGIWGYLLMKGLGRILSFESLDLTPVKQGELGTNWTSESVPVGWMRVIALFCV